MDGLLCLCCERPHATVVPGFIDLRMRTNIIRLRRSLMHYTFQHRQNRRIELTDIDISEIPTIPEIPNIPKIYNKSITLNTLINVGARLFIGQRISTQHALILRGHDY